MAVIERHYSVTGLKCGGCDARAREAVASLPGFVEATFDHKTGKGVVRGLVDAEAVIKALAALGYAASLRNAS